ncbi:MAG: chromosome segregation protein SMC [Acidimicrobiia bacterium]
MLLKSLEIKGFKSFADPVTIEFEPGITVIVGPNGSGKSNIVDAICWAMGTQAISTLRTGSMQEVIFAGSGVRKPLGRAKVTITIDNSDGTLPVDFSEVAISRTLYRNGESEYAINGASCRLVDIQELLSDTGVGRQLHTIVGQGQLDAVLTATPEDRRSMIEEAAGILKYKKRKERASRRLATTEENLSRIYDIMGEIKRQIRPLQRQAAAVQRYREVSAEAALLRKLLAWRRLAAAREARRQAQERLEAVRKEVERLESLSSSLSEEIESVASDRNKVSSVRRSGDEALSKLRDLRQACGSLGDIAREKKKFFEAVSLRSAAQHLDLLGAEKDQLDEKLAEIEAVLPVLREELEAAITEERRLAAEAESLRMEMAAGSEAALRAAEAAGERSSLESSIARAEIEVSQVVERARALDQRRLELVEERNRLDEEIRRLDARSQPLSEEVSRLVDLREVAQREIEELEREREEAQAELSIWNGRLEALKELAAQYSSTEGPSRIAEASPDGFIGTFWDLLEVERGSEVAVEAALGDFSRAVVVNGTSGVLSAAAVLQDGEEAAWLLDAQSVENDRGIKVRFRIGPVTQVPPSSEARPLVTAVKVRGGDERIYALVQILLSRSYLVANWKSAVELAERYPELTFVTPQGGIAGAGVYRVGAQASGPFSQLALLTDVATKARAAENRLRSVTANLARRRKDLHSLERDLEATRSALAECDAALTAAANELGRVDPELSRVDAERATLKKAELSLVARIQKDRQKLEEIEKLLEQLKAGAPSQESHAYSLAGADEPRLSEVEEALASSREKRRELEKALTGAEERHSMLASRREQIAKKLQSEQQRLAAEDRKRHLASYLARKAQAIEEAAGGLLASISALEKDAYSVCDIVRPVDDTCSRRLGVLRKRLEETSQSLAAAAESLRAAEIEAVRTATVLEQVESEYKSVTGEEAPSSRDYLQAGTGALIFPPELDELDDQTVQAQLNAVERDLEKMGPINQLALKDYEEASSRLEFYAAQAQDLEESKRELQKVIAAVDSQIELLFRNAFDDIARSFETTFQMLFEGGSGRLYLQNPSDPLTSGVEVEAKPAGKAVKRLSLLSGGERSLAALAFLFSIYRARPSPFYILDEVEAALDDTNLERFLGLLRDFRDHGQVVIVTHQKRTVEIADCLYGVSMQSEGVSKVVSYKVSESLSYS